MFSAVESRKQNESKSDKVKRAEELMRRLSIIDIADNDINEVSGGQLQSMYMQKHDK